MHICFFIPYQMILYFVFYQILNAEGLKKPFLINRMGEKERENEGKRNRAQWEDVYVLSL